MIPPDPSPGIAVAIFYRFERPVRPVPASWPTNDQCDMGYHCEGQRGFRVYEYWPVTADSIMLYSLRRRYGERALCVPLNPR
jgi:hypothetical protein